MSSRRLYRRYHTLALFALLPLLAGCPRNAGNGGGNAPGQPAVSDRLPEPGSDDYRNVASAFHIGWAALQVDDPTRAQSELAKVTQEAPGEPAGWANLARLALKQNRLDEAARNTEAALAQMPQDAKEAQSVVLAMQGELAAKQGRAADAIQSYRRAVEADPQNLKARYALAEAIRAEAGPNADAEEKAQMEEILKVQPDNIEALLQVARISAKMGDAAALNDAIARLNALSANWSPEIREQLAALKTAAQSEPRAAATRVTVLKNVLARNNAFQQSIQALKTPSTGVGETLDRFVKLPNPSPTPAPPDTETKFAPEALASAPKNAGWAGAVIFTSDGAPTPITADAKQVWIEGKTPLAFPGKGTAPARHAVAPMDWSLVKPDKSSHRTDLALAGAGGLKLYEQNVSGDLKDVTARVKLPASLANAPLFGAWGADVELDGDLDILVAPVNGALVELRNNADGTFKVQQPFPGLKNVRDFAWADLDGDGDPDAAFADAQGALTVFENERSGLFKPVTTPANVGNIVALAVAETNRDTILDLLALKSDGSILSVTGTPEGPARESAELARWESAPTGMAPGKAGLLAVELDNNGAVDLAASDGTATQVWLQDGEGKFAPLGTPLALNVFDAADLNDDGRLDLIGVAAGGEPQRALNSGSKNYHWRNFRFRAKPVVKSDSAGQAGDQRINSYAIGGEIEIRSGMLYQKQPIAGPQAHFGLGERSSVEVARINWPNGDWQAEFGLDADHTMVTEQRLKGSCPFLYTWNGKEMVFVTDCIWRSPLGLKINAQDTANVAMTEDWVKIRGDQLAPRDGFYDLSITAELWETHYFDHVSLMVVDHPVGTDIWVDERFAFPPPPLKVYATKTPQPVARATDDDGNDVTETLAHRDGAHVDNFGRGDYQGVTRDHYLEIEIGDDLPQSGPLWLIAYGWIHPTDSSLNVAISQGKHAPPSGLSLEIPDGRGGWKAAKPGLGFPAGKVKTILINLEGVFAPGTPRRLRLRTNLEIFWDQIQVAEGAPNAPLKTERLQAETAELRYRGFSRVKAKDASSPELPESYAVESTAPRWRDLIGYHTRFGDVRPLLKRVDDRYVIMNAGDEMAFRFPALPPPPEGWTRNYVLIGDGWEKDGDYNTTFSKTVLPLPSHTTADYRTPPGRLEDDPVYRRFPQDWQDYHTRYVTPDAFRNALRPGK